MDVFEGCEPIIARVLCAFARNSPKLTYVQVSVWGGWTKAVSGWILDIWKLVGWMDGDSWIMCVCVCEQGMSYLAAFIYLTFLESAETLQLNITIGDRTSHACT